MNGRLAMLQIENKWKPEQPNHAGTSWGALLGSADLFPQALQAFPTPARQGARDETGVPTFS